MREGPTISPYRRGYQTISSCCVKETWLIWAVSPKEFEILWFFKKAA
jgi:hypothetical protein